jgi:pantetheine-phosphate adenylyltransferase
MTPVATQPTQTVAIYPGTFDPITNGHRDVIARATKIADRLIVAVLRNQSKHPLFTVEERVNMLREVTEEFPNVEVDGFDGLLVDYAAQKGANLIIRGIRAISDYEKELQMALMNRRLRPEVETVFPDGGRAVFFCQLAPGERNHQPGREYFRPGADRRGREIETPHLGDKKS